MIQQIHKISRRLIFFAALTILLLGFAPIFCIEKSASFGGKKGWASSAQVQRGLTFAQGRYGYQSLVLSPNSRKTTDYTDILLDFEDAALHDGAGNYTVIASEFLPATKVVMGNGAALSRGTGGARLRAGQNALFGTSGSAGSFTIEFWLRPSIAENGEVIFAWRSSRIINNHPFYQTITACFFDNRFEWNFHNVFAGERDLVEDVFLRSAGTIIPQTWSHHILSFDEESGLFEYVIDGRTADMTFVTSTKREGGEIYQAILGNRSNIELCPQFSGTIDDFRIVRQPFSQMNENAYFANTRSGGTIGASARIAGKAGAHYDLYAVEGGRFVSQPIQAAAGASVKTLESIVDVPSETAVRFFVRGGDNAFAWTENEPAWIPIRGNVPASGVIGKYFQIAADLYPDGSGTKSPSLSEVSIKWQEPVNPLPPFNVRAVAGEAGTVTISWSFSVDDNSSGYYVYYGERAGEYISYNASQGASPVRVTGGNSITLTGLKSGKIYYFAVASYSKLGDRIIGDFSKEVSARVY
ncbi:MAG: hypothetical protein Ta2A_02590 [Treponemataceae bacterium]|nr:MAG: hypothetical protein Ta2A_02590 [Treponemataceae bacterium]